MNIVSRFKNKRDRLNFLFKTNAKSIVSYNASLLKTLVFSGIIVIMIPIAVSLFVEKKASLIPTYILSIFLLLLVFILFQINPLKKCTLCAVYIVFVGSFLFSIYMSVINSHNQRATIILGLFCIFPMSIIEKPFKVKLLSFIFYLLHTILAFIYKDSSLALDDAINTFCFMLLGNVVGDKLIQIRIEAFESKRQLVLERETDDLTGLKNRGKLFRMINSFEVDNSNIPTGVIMMDIDNFKEYNDKFGHAAGDYLLSSFGKLLLSYEEKFNLQFFRYGGEEFAGLSWGYDINELREICEQIKTSVNEITDCCQKVKVSIGIVDCKIKDFKNYEKYIELADFALYKAKSKGKNRVMCFDETMDLEFFDIKKATS